MQYKSLTHAPWGLIMGVICLVGSCTDRDSTPADAGRIVDSETEHDGGATDATVEASMPSDATAFLAQYAASVCEMYAPCCEQRSLGYDADGCAEWFRDVTAAYFTGEFQPDRGAQCLADLAAARAADADRCGNELNFDRATFREACREAFTTPPRSGAPLGGDCLLGADCARAEGEGSVICYGGMCVLDVRGTAGEGPCFVGAGSGVELPLTRLVRCEAASGLYCDRGENQCAPHVADGELCPRSTACAETAMCVGGRCETLPGPGEPCLNAVPGAGGFCRPGSACDIPSLTCDAPLEEGAACREPAQCVTRACMSGTCQPPEFTRALNCTGT